MPLRILRKGTADRPKARRVSGRVDPKRSMIAKKNYRKNKVKIQKSLKKFRRSAQGKRFYKKLGRLKSTKLSASIELQNHLINSILNELDSEDSGLEYLYHFLLELDLSDNDIDNDLDEIILFSMDEGMGANLLYHWYRKEDLSPDIDEMLNDIQNGIDPNSILDLFTNETPT